MRAIWEFETDPAFSDEERAALRFAWAAAAVPCEVTDEHFAGLEEHFTDDQIVHILAEVCNTAWSNGWNDTMSTPLEAHPLRTMAEVSPGWDPGRNRPDEHSPAVREPTAVPPAEPPSREWVARAAAFRPDSTHRGPAPVRREDVPEHGPVLRRFEESLGFVPVDVLVLARRPPLLAARAAMFEALLDSDVEHELGMLVQLMVGIVADARRAVGQRVAALVHTGVAVDRVRAVWHFEDSTLFSERERVALRFAHAAGRRPNAVDDDHYVELRMCFSEGEIIDLAANVCEALWSNRWNESVALPVAEDAAEAAPVNPAERSRAR